MVRPRSNCLLYLCALTLSTVAAMSPWVRNRHYLRDMYDYGLVLAANGHMDRGERPYVDFTTPIQAGFLRLNWLIEHATGGTYGGLTWGAAGLILVSLLVLTSMLARRWPMWLALMVGGAITIASASQHTILWHNALGVFCLSMVVWSAAIAPIWRKTTWPWHVLTAAGLVLGGINKINFQLIALCAAGAWIVRAHFAATRSWDEVVRSLAGVLLAGVIVPVSLELWWTGAAISQWWHNVVGMAAGQRVEILSEILSATFLWHQTHPYYGQSLITPVGFFGLLMTILTAVAVSGGRHAGIWTRTVSVVSALLAGLAGAVLLQSNFEISHLGLAAWLALLVSVWLAHGDEISAGHRRLLVGVAVPAALLLISAWSSAWIGQRSQFGYSTASRTDYQEVAVEVPRLQAMGGLWLPPEVVGSLKMFDIGQVDPDKSGRYNEFYGLGTEWLDRFYPAIRKRNEPLWVHWGTSYDESAIRLLSERMSGADRYEAIYCTVARDEWPDEIRAVLDKYYDRQFVGSTLLRWSPKNPGPDLSDAFDMQAKLGGNIVGSVLHFDRHPMTFSQTTDGAVIMGTRHSAGAVLLNTPTYRMKGVAMIDRLPGTGDNPVEVRARITVHGSTPEELLWSAHLQLQPGEQTKRLPFVIDPGGRRVMFWISTDRPGRSPVFAGYRELEIEAAVEGPIEAPALRGDVSTARMAKPTELDALFDRLKWRPEYLLLRDAQVDAEGAELAPGGELWFHTQNMTGLVEGGVKNLSANTTGPMVRVVWYKGGRLQLMQNDVVPAGGSYPFRVWTAEPGGWIGVLTDRSDSAAVKVKITSAQMQP